MTPPTLAARDAVDSDAVLLELVQHADRREGTGASACKRDAERAAGEACSERRDRRTEVVRAAGVDAARCDGVVPGDDDSRGRAPRRRGRRSASIGHVPLRRRLIRRGDEHDAVRLAHAEVVPLRVVIRRRDEYDAIGFALGAVERVDRDAARRDDVQVSRERLDEQRETASRLRATARRPRRRAARKARLPSRPRLCWSCTASAVGTARVPPRDRRRAQRGTRRRRCAAGGCRGAPGCPPSAVAPARTASSPDDLAGREPR